MGLPVVFPFFLRLIVHQISSESYLLFLNLQKVFFGRQIFWRKFHTRIEVQKVVSYTQIHKNGIIFGFCSKQLSFEPSELGATITAV